MEVHAHVLCTNLHTLPRNVQLSRKASYRQDLTKLNLPYRIATRDELNALKGAGVLSMQAPSSMLMRVEDALKLLKEKGKMNVRKEVKRKWREWTCRAARGDSRNEGKRGKENRAVRRVAAEERRGANEVEGEDDDDGSDSKKGGRRLRKHGKAADVGDMGSHKSEEDDVSSSSEEEDELNDIHDDDEDDDVNHGNTAARILSSHQFHLLWSTPISPPVPPPTPTLSSSPATTPTNSPATTATSLPVISSTTSPSPTLPPFSPLAQLKKRPRKPSNPFSLSWSRWLGETEVSLEVVSDSDGDRQRQQREREEVREQKRRRLLPHHRLKAHSV